MTTRAGFVALIGEPNAGKSTLLNRMVGAKVSIVTHKVQTTRARIRGVAMEGRAQIVFVDTPGLFRPRRRLDRAMVAAAWSGVVDADMVVLLVEAHRGITDGVRAILEALIVWGQKEKDTVLLSEYVRTSLSRYISYKYSGGNNILPAYLFTPDVEDTIRNAIRQTSAGSYLALEPDVSARLLENIKKTVSDISSSAHKPVLLTSMDIRRYVRKLIEGDLYELPVLSFQELTSEINTQPLGRVTL